MTDRQIFEIIKQNVRKSFYDKTTLPGTLTEHYHPETGSFSDIDYVTQNWSVWGPYKHLVRAERLCRIWATPENPFFKSPDIPDMVCKILRFFMQGGFVSDNWWMNDVGVPSCCGVIKLLMRDELKEKLSEEENERLLKLFLGNPKRPRLFDVNSSPDPLSLRPYDSCGLHIVAQMYDSILYFAATETDAEKCLRSIRDFIKAIEFEFSVITWANGYGNPCLPCEEETIKTDYSYQQHCGCLVQNTYGAGLFEELAKFFALLEGTGIATSEKTNREMSDLLLNGFSYMLYRGYSPMTVIGRNAASADVKTYKRSSLLKSFAYICKILLESNTLPFPGELEKFMERLKNPQTAPHFCGTRFYWHSDFLSHNRENFQFTVHLSSTRVKRPEAPLKKNRRGIYLGDGCYNILVHGDEYEQLSPCLDWRRLPGTTSNLNCTDYQLNPESEIDTLIDPDRIYGGAKGTTDFAGGISDGENGFFAAEYDHLGISAKKAWFCFDSIICCLGSGICMSRGAHAFTTVNQCRSRGEVLTDRGSLTDSEAVLTDCRWILHDGIGYLMLENVPLSAENKVRSGCWKLVDTDSGTDDLVRQKIFSLGIDHKTAGDSYAYAIIPHTDKSRMEAFDLPVTILSNNESCQAVQRGDTGQLQAVFYSPGKLKINQTEITVDSPCAVMFTKQGEDYTIRASSPSHSEKSITVTLSGDISNSITFRQDGGFRYNNLGRPACYTKKDGFLPFFGAKGDMDYV